MKTIEFLEEAIEENLCDLEDWQRFHRTQKLLTIQKNYKLHIIKINIFWSLKDTIKKKKDKPQLEENIYMTYI